MGIQIIKNGVIVHDDNKTPEQKKIEELERIILDLQNQIKDLKSRK